MTIGLGSGRAVWAVIAAIAERWPDGVPLRAVAASERTEEHARRAGIELTALDGASTLDLVIDGADEVTAGLELLKGGGGALLREKLVAVAAERFVVVAEVAKRVERLGQTSRVPVEVVRFGWQQTARRLSEVAGDPRLRAGADGAPFTTDEGHYLLDCVVGAGAPAAAVAAQVKATIGVVEHGLFLDLADAALLGRPDGGVDELVRQRAR